MKGKCALVHFNFFDQMKYYGYAVNTGAIIRPGRGQMNVFSGFVLDVGSCSDGFAVSISQDDQGYIRQWDFGQRLNYASLGEIYDVRALC